MPTAFHMQLFQKAVNSIHWRVQKVLEAFWKPNGQELEAGGE